MRKSSSVLLAAALMMGMATFASLPAQAFDWCYFCENDPDCFACCKCDGGTTIQCDRLCGSPDSELEIEATLTLEDEGEIPACTADEAPSTDEAPSNDEPPPAAS